MDSLIFLEFVGHLQQHLVILFISRAFAVPNALKTSDTNAVRQCSKSNLTCGGVTNKQK